MIRRPRVGKKVVWRVFARGELHVTRATIELTHFGGQDLTIRLETGSRVFVPNAECYTLAEALRLALQHAAGQEPT